jgi:hypothetical protein
MTDAPPDWVEIRSCTWLHEAEMIRSVLESVGIASMIPNEYTLAAQPLYAPAIGGVRVLVQRSDVERAKEVLAREQG